MEVRCVKHGRQSALYVDDDKKAVICKKCFNEILNKRVLKIIREAEVIDLAEHKRKRDAKKPE